MEQRTRKQIQINFLTLLLSLLLVFSALVFFAGCGDDQVVTTKVTPSDCTLKYELHIKHAFAVEVMEGNCRSLSGDDSLIYLEIEGAVVPFGKDSIVYHKAWSE